MVSIRQTSELVSGCALVVPIGSSLSIRAHLAVLCIVTERQWQWQVTFKWQRDSGTGVRGYDSTVPRSTFCVAARYSSRPKQIASTPDLFYLLVFGANFHFQGIMSKVPDFSTFDGLFKTFWVFFTLTEKFLMPQCALFHHLQKIIPNIIWCILPCCKTVEMVITHCERIQCIFYFFDNTLEVIIVLFESLTASVLVQCLHSVQDQLTRAGLSL